MLLQICSRIQYGDVLGEAASVQHPHTGS